MKVSCSDRVMFPSRISVADTAVARFEITSLPTAVPEMVADATALEHPGCCNGRAALSGEIASVAPVDLSVLQ
jgi:hypothetical protein